MEQVPPAQDDAFHQTPLFLCVEVGN